MLKTISSYCGYLVIRSTLELLAILPDRLSELIILQLIKLILCFDKRFKKAGKINLQTIFPDKTDKEHSKIFQKSLKVLARNISTFAKLDRYSLEDLEKMFDLSELSCAINTVKEKNGENSGMIFPTLHYGCFELFVQAHNRVSGQNVCILARGFGIDKLDKWWDSKRERFGNKVFSRKGAYKHVEANLKKGRAVAILFDQNVKRNHAVFSNFFGTQAATTKTVSLAAIRTRAPVILTVSAEVERNKYKVYAKIINPPSSGTNEQRILEHTNSLHRYSEELIRKHPEQWFWIHRRFKTRPSGEIENFYD